MYKYGFTFKDSAGYGMYPLTQEKINGNQINKEVVLNRPWNGSYTNLADKDSWQDSGFNINDKVNLKVLRATLENETGDSKNTCTLEQKGKNHDEIKEATKKEGTLINDGENINNVFGKTMARESVEAIYTRDFIIENQYRGKIKIIP